jgi:uncharacterized protein YbbK (DUF523 family)
MAKLLTCSECGENKQEGEMTWILWANSGIWIPVCPECWAELKTEREAGSNRG